MDIDGEAWASPPSIGCDEIYPGSVVGNFTVSIAPSSAVFAPGFPIGFQANISGPTSASIWNFGDGTMVTNEAYISHTWATNGDYTVTLTGYNDSYPTGQIATITVHVSVPTIYYVDLNCPYPIPPYSDWSTAATNIQDAIDVAPSGSLVLVTNGNGVLTYNGHGGFYSNWLAIYQVGGRSIYGVSNRVALYKPITVQSVNGPQYTWIMGAGFSPNIRGVYMTNGATLSGFTVTNCSAHAGDQIQGQSGGGIWSESTNDIITNCTVMDCFAFYYGNGVYSGTFYNCLLASNPPPNRAGAQYGGGAAASILNNCVLLANGAVQSGGGAAYSILNNCTITNNSGSGVYLCNLTGCMITHNWSAGYGGGAIGGTLNNCTLTRNSATYGGGAQGQLTSPIVLNNCVIISNTANYGGGAYGYLPYNSNYCVLNNCIIASNYASYYGGGAVLAFMNNCTITTNFAHFKGGGVEASVLNNCLLAGNSASTGGGGADGFYLSGGILNNCTLSGNIAPSGGGAGYFTLNNCILNGNLSTNGSGGGGAFSCTLSNCILTGNISSIAGGGGGGAASSTLINCLIMSNSAPGNSQSAYLLGHGGGTYGCTVINSLLAWNSAQTNGGGDYGSTLINCTLALNTAPIGGGIYNSTAKNSIIYDNTGGNYYYTSAPHPYWLYYCCTTPATNGPGNITNDPAFVNLAGGDFHLQPGSPCINSGDNSYIASYTDLDGNPRTVAGTVDIGAYEYQTPTSVLSYAWAQQYGLPTDGSADYLDTDGVGMQNWQKSIAGLNPTNPASVLAMLPTAATNNAAGITASWDSVNSRTYYLMRSTNLAVHPPFSMIQSNLAGQAGVTSFTDVTATSVGPYFYRVGVQ